MKSVEIMLNFLRKKTVKRNEGRNDDPPLMTSSEDTARRSEKSRSVAFERDFTNGGPLRLHSASMHSTCSLDDVRSAPSQRAAYVKNHRKTSLASGLDDCCSEFQNGIIRPSNEQPTKLYHSPKASQRLSNSHRSSGHSRSLSAIADPALRSADRKHQRSSVQVTPPRLYRKNPQQQQQQQQKVLPFHTPSSSSTDAAAAEMSFSGSHEGSMQWSFGRYGVDDASSPVPPPRKKRSSRAGRDVDGDKSSQTSSSTEATSDGRRPCDAFCFDSEFAADSSSNIESPEFRCNLPNDFSNLGLDILNIPSAVLIQSNEKSNFDLLQEIDRKKKKQKKRDDAYLCNLASPTTKDSAAFIKSRDVLRIEEPSSCRTFDSDSFILNNECSTSSVCDSSAQSVFHNETAELSRTPKHPTAVIVKSIFSKNQKQEFSERFNLRYDGGGGGGGEEDDASSAKGGQTFDFPPQSASFAASQSRSSPGATDVLDSFRNASESCSVDENSACVGPSVALNSDRNSQSVYREDLSTNGVRVLQPDVLIGTQQSHAPSFGCCGSSSADDSKQSPLQGDPVHNRVHSTMKPFTCDLSVGHQLHGFPSQTLVAINERWTSQDVIERILTLERISDDWFLYGLFICSHDPSHGNNGVLELDMDDFLARHLDEDDRQTGSVWFELRRTEGLKIRVSCDASFEKPKTIAFEISRRILCRFVVDAAVAKFELRSPTKFCLIELDRSRKELVMRRINESEVLSRLNSGHFLLCEKEFLFESRRKVDQLPLTSPLMSSFSSRLSYLPTRNAFTHEVDALKSQVKQLEAKLVDNERHFRQKLTRHQSQMGRYRSIALCTAPNSRLLLLEEECRRLTEEMQDHERQIKTQELEDICRISSDSKKERERLLSMKNACMKLNNERQEVYDCLLQETAKVERQEQSNGRCLRSSSELFSICRHFQGGRLHAVEIDRSELLLDGVELVSCSEGGGHCLRVRRSSSSISCHHLTEGDRILEINGHRALHLTDVELVALLENTTENLRVVVLRDEARNNNNNSNNNNNVHQL